MKITFVPEDVVRRSRAASEEVAQLLDAISSCPKGQAVAVELEATEAARKAASRYRASLYARKLKYSVIVSGRIVYIKRK
ncbi:MAG: hypothetical protein KatS3mg045_1927 [Bellilinea sp.]|nr:MAG: hypothetical protein KatS3mg045_1927 [Bellilinea sp.]